MDTILRTNNFFSSFRWKMVLIYISIVLVSLLFFQTVVIWVVESYLLAQEVDAARADSAVLVSETGELMAAGRADDMYEFCVRRSEELDGRILLTDADGIVQMDAASRLNGVRLTYDQVTDVLQKGSEFSYGYYKLKDQEADMNENWFLQTLRWVLGRTGSGEWVAYCVSPVSSQNGLMGSVLLSVSIQDVVERMNYIGTRITMITLGIAVIAAIVSLFASGMILKPVATMTDSIERMGQGDFSQRVHIKGRSEFARMGSTFNQMAERLQNLDTQRSQFVSNASHEMKTPLASVKILVETLQGMDPLDEALTREFLGDINSEIDRMNRLISDLLTLVRRDEQDLTQHFSVVDWVSVTTDVCGKLLPLADSRSIELSLTAPEAAHVNGSEMMLGQMVTNLVDNAIKYTPEGGKVDVDLVRSGRSWILTVKDSGIGIAESDIPYIFDRFYRVDKARSRATGGTGLGLAIVKETAQQHGGSVSVDSVPGKGTAMHVMLPAAD